MKSLLIFLLLMLICIIWNINMSIANKWWIPSHIQSIDLSFYGFEENESVSFMSSVILPGSIFSWELPVINRTTMSKLIDNIVSSDLKIDIMDVYFEYFLTFIVEYRFTSNSWWLDSPCILSILLVLKLIEISTLSSWWIHRILIFIWLIFIPHWMFVKWWLSTTILLNILLLERSHVILMVLVIIWRMIPLVLHPYLLMMHRWPVTSILCHFLVILWLSPICTILSLHWFSIMIIRIWLSIMIIRMHIIDIPNWLIVIWHLPLIWLMIILPIVVRHFALIRVMVVHLNLCK